jgi:Domain of unknown function (DUF4173)
MESSALKLLIAALVLGAAGDGLLRGGMWRLGFALWISAIIAAVFMLGGRRTTLRLILLGGLALAAFGLVLRDSPMLYVIDAASVVCMGAITLWYGSGGELSQLTVVETARVGVIAAVNTIGGAASAVGATMTRHRGTDAGRASARALVIGAVLAVPPLFVVARLLSASDIVFERMLQRAISSITSDGISHLFIIALLAWVAAGWLQAASGRGTGQSVPQLRAPGLSFTAVAVGLYSMIGLLLLFVVTQARVVFGGAAFLRETAGLSVANYARAGFFQLIVAAVVVLISLAVAEWLMAEDDEPGHLKFAVAGAVLLALVFTLLMSSAVRIWLYVSEFGLSVDRSFASAGIVWVCGLLIAFALTTLRGRAIQFMPVAVAVSSIWVATVNLVNPEAIVVRTNVARAVAGNAFDAPYHGTLSADALPVLLHEARQLTPSDCALLESALRQTWNTRLADSVSGNVDWRSRNWPLVRAARWQKSGASICRKVPVR